IQAGVDITETRTQIRRSWLNENLMVLVLTKENLTVLTDISRNTTLSEEQRTEIRECIKIFCFIKLAFDQSKVFLLYYFLYYVIPPSPEENTPLKDDTQLACIPPEIKKHISCMLFSITQAKMNAEDPTGENALAAVKLLGYPAKLGFFNTVSNAALSGIQY